MRHLARDAHFADEALAADRVAREIAREKLQRDRLAEFEVVGAVHLAHAAAAEQADDAIAIGEDRAGCEAADGDCVGRDEPPDAWRLRESRRDAGGAGTGDAVRVNASGAGESGAAHDGQNRLPSGADA